MHARRFFALVLLAFGIAASGCAAAQDETDAAQSEDAIHAWTNGPSVRQLYKVISQVNAADGTVKDNSGRLAKELSTVGPALTRPQQSAYVAAFNAEPSVEQARRDFVTSSTALRDFLASEAGGGQIKKIAKLPGGDGAARSLFEAYERLATTPVALPAAEFAAWTLDARNRNDALAKAVAKYDWTNKVLTPALTRGAGEALVEADGDAESAFSAFVGRVGFLAYAGQDHIEAYTGWIALTASLRSRDLQAFERLEPRLQKLPVVGALLAVGVLYNSLSAGNDIRNGEFSQETLDSIGDAAQGLSGALVSISNAGLLARYGGTAAATFSKFIERITPGLGVICTTAALRRHWGEAEGPGAVGAYIGALGDTIALVGVLAESFGVTAPLAAIIVGLGYTISFLGDVVRDWLIAKFITDEERACLAKAGIPTAVADVLVRTNARLMQEWASDLKYDAPKIQWLAAHAPDTLTAGWLKGFDVKSFEALVNAFGYGADGGFALLQRIPDATTEANGGEGVYAFVNGLQLWSYKDANAKAEWLGVVRTQAESGYDPSYARPFQNALGYLQAH